MPTTVIKTIGSGGDYADFNAAASAIPADLVTADQLWRLRVLAAGVSITSAQSISGKTTDATRYIVVEADTNASFKDHASKLTNPLTYDATKGAAIMIGSTVGDYGLALNFASVALVQGLQIRKAAGSGNPSAMLSLSGPVKNCILDAPNTSYNQGSVRGKGAINCLFIKRSGTDYDPRFLDVGFESSTQVVGCTFINLGGSATLIGGQSGAPTIKDCALFGLTALTDNGGWGLTTTNCATSMATLAGTNNLTSLAAASQFVSATADFRILTGSALIGAGARDAANTGDLDIIGSARSTTAPTIGAWEFSGAADTTPPTLTGAITIGTVTSSSIAITWPTASDNVAISSYEVSKDGGTTWVDTGSTATGYTFAGLSASTTYQLRVRAKDPSGNVSTPALAASQATTSGSDTTPPTLTGSITVSSVTPSSYGLSWPTGSDNVAVTAYEYSLDGGSIWLDNGLNTTKAVTGRTPGSTDQVRVRARDAAGNVSTPALSTSVSLPAIAGIVSEPLKDNAGNLLVNAPLAFYAIYNDTTGALVVRKTGLSTNSLGVVSFTDAALTAGVTYRHDWETSDGKRRMPRKAAA